MWRRHYDNNCRYDGVKGECYQTKPVDHHGSKLPVHNHLVVLVVLFHAVCDEPQFPDDALKFSRIVETVRFLGVE